MDGDHLKWRDAGGELWKASILAAEGRENEAQAKARAIFAALPVLSQTAVMGNEAGASAPPSSTGR